MNKLTAFSMVLGALLASQACGKTADSSGSNSNWLIRCHFDGACADGYSCQCGVCTKACADSTDCAPLASDAHCTMIGSCQSAQSAAACIVACSSDADCVGLGTGFSCASGVCGKAAANAEDPCRTQRDARAAFIAANKACSSDLDCQAVPSSCLDGVEDCSGFVYFNQSVDSGQFATLNEALASCLSQPGHGPDTCGGTVCSKDSPAPAACNPSGHCGPACTDFPIEIGKAFGQAVRAADTACSQDSDCTVVNEHVSTPDGQPCFAGCGMAAISKAGLAELDSNIADLGSSLACTQTVANGCPVLQPPCPSPPTAACVSGHCEIPGRTCSDLQASITQQMLDAEQSASHACQTASDCARTERMTDCVDACETDPVNADAIAALGNAFDDLGQQQCPNFLASGCEAPIPACTPSAGLACVNGECVSQ